MSQNPEQQYPGQQPPQGQQQYPGGMPPAPPLNPTDAAPVVRPQSLNTAVLLWLVAAGIRLIGIVLSFVTADEVAEETAQRMGMTIESTEPAIGSTIFGIVLVVAWVAIVFAMRSGQNWARILLTVLGGIYLLLAIIGLVTLGILFAIGGLGVLQGLLQIISLVVVVAAIVFQFRGESNRFFQRS